MKGLEKRIGEIMDENGKGRLAVSALFLRLLSILYGAVVKAIDILYKRGVFLSERLPCKVISIGNLCVGGTGKTPMALYATGLLQEMGYRVCILSRGYKGGAEASGGIVSDGKTVLMDAAAAGDEPVMMAQSLWDVPVVVGKNRVKSGKDAVAAFHPDVIVLDDGFQHRKLFRDVNILLLDYEKPFGNRQLIPGGRLREPPSAMARCDAIVFTRSKRNALHDKRNILYLQDTDIRTMPVFFAYHVPFLCKVVKTDQRIVYPDKLDPGGAGVIFLKDKKVFAFSGIAGNRDFKEMVSQCCGTLTGFNAFPDHHRYTEKDLKKMFALVAQQNPDLVVTTEKDYVKISSLGLWPADLAVMGVRVSLEKDEAAFRRFLIERLS